MVAGTLIVKSVIVIAALIIGYASIFITKKDDGPIEQAAEEVIKEETGVSVDLTPKPDNPPTP